MILGQTLIDPCGMFILLLLGLAVLAKKTFETAARHPEASAVVGRGVLHLVRGWFK